MNTPDIVTWNKNEDAKPDELAKWYKSELNQKRITETIEGKYF